MVGPIETLQAGAARIGGGDLSQRIAVKTGDELEALADQFNDMAGRLQESYADLEQRVELRTRELSQSLDDQSATTEVLRVINSASGDLSLVLDAILSAASRICDANSGIIFRQQSGKWIIHYSNPEVVDRFGGHLTLDASAGQMSTLHDGDLVSVQGRVVHGAYQATTVHLIEHETN